VFAALLATVLLRYARRRKRGTGMRDPSVDAAPTDLLQPEHGGEA